MLYNMRIVISAVLGRNSQNKTKGFFIHVVLRSGPEIGCSLYQVVSYILGVLFTGVFFFSPFFDEVLRIPRCSLSRQSLN